MNRIHSLRMIKSPNNLLPLVTATTVIREILFQILKKVGVEADICPPGSSCTPSLPGRGFA